MEDKYIVSIYVAECNEFRRDGAIFEGIYNVSEALEVRNKLPKDNTPVIGLRIHKKGEKAVTDVLMDVLIGEVIHIEFLEYVPGISMNNDVVNYIAELMAFLPDMQIQGKVPEYLSDRIKQYTESHKREEEKFKEQIIRKLSQLTVEAIKYSKSDDKAEQRYAADLLEYAILQREAVSNGQKDIDLSVLPQKEDYYESKTEKQDKVKQMDPENKLTSMMQHRRDSLLGKLYDYKEQIKRSSAQMNPSE